LSELTADVCVVGGGPAGSSVARGLAGLGHAVYLIERGNCRRPNVESLAPATASLLETLGVLKEIQQAGFVRCEQTRLRWFDAPDALQRGRTAAIVERDRFDRILLEAARRAGASVLYPARALTPARRNAVWSIPVRTVSGWVTIQLGSWLMHGASARPSDRMAQVP